MSKLTGRIRESLGGAPTFLSACSCGRAWATWEHADKNVGAPLDPQQLANAPKLTRKYSLRNTFVALALLAATAAQASVTVTNVAATQRPGTNLVDIAYDVASTVTKLVAVSPVVPEGMVLVQGGSLPSIGNGAITVASFCIGKYEVTWAEWQTVRTWAATNGYYDNGVSI